jgi:glycosyltransferase involved in cell wall biosynthesis
VVDPTDAELRALYERCTAVLFTAFNEDWGIVPLEAMAAGKPVVAVNRGGPSETVLHGETGYLEPDIPAAFARRMIELAADPALCRRLGLAGAERAQQFSWDAFVAGLDMIIEKTAWGASSTS